MPASGAFLALSVRFLRPPEEAIRQLLTERGFLWDQDASVWRARRPLGELAALKVWIGSIGGELVGG